MLHTKFQGNPFSGSWEENVLMFLPYTGMAASLVMRLEPNILRSLPFCPKTAYLIAYPVASEEKPFENVDRQLTCDVWTKSPNDLDL